MPDAPGPRYVRRERGGRLSFSTKLTTASVRSPTRSRTGSSTPSRCCSTTRSWAWTRCSCRWHSRALVVSDYRAGWLHEAAGMPDISLYEGTKHSFATDVAERTGDWDALQRTLGHSDSRSTQRYVGATERRLESVYPQEDLR